MAALVFVPIWRESVNGRFVLESANYAVIRAQVPGRVTDVYVAEGQVVSAGASVAQLRDLTLASRQAATEAALRKATAELNLAEYRYVDTGTALTRRDQFAKQADSVASQAAQLVLKSPIAGTVTTPRMADELNRFVKPGTELAEVADLRTMRARIYVSEYELHKYRPDSMGMIGVDGLWGTRPAARVQVSPTPSEVVPGLIDLSKFKGMQAPIYYEMDLLVDNSDGRLKPGMAGTARIYGRHKNLAGLAYREVSDFFGRKIW